MCAAVTGSIIAVGSAAYQISNAEKQKSDAKKAIEAFQRQDLKNPFENIELSREKANQQTDANLSSFATSVDALQRGGTRSVLAGLPKLNESNILLQNIISADLDKQAKERDFAIARGEERNKSLREGRENAALQGLGQQLQTARQDSASGISNLASGLLAGSSAIQEQNKSPKIPEETLQEVLAFDKTEEALAQGIAIPKTDNASIFNNPLLYTS